MKLKFVILIILILILFLNYLQNQELFFETTSTVRSLIENKIDDMIGASHLTEQKHQVKLKSHTNIVDSVKIRTTDVNPTSYYSLSRDKILISLFYDPLDKFSRDFYDDTEITHTDFEKLAAPAASSIVSISDGSSKPWNILKKKIKENNASDNQDKNPYFSKKLIHIEEIPCSISRMEKCHIKDSILDMQSDTHTGAPDMSKASQPPRNKNLVNKLPKIISSFYVPVDSENSEHIIVEYDGDYTLFNENNPVNLINIIKYMRDSFDKHLEIKDIDFKEDIENNELRKMVHHLKHKHPDTSLPNFHSSTIKSNFELLNEKKSVLPPIYNNSFIYKCKLCPQYVKSSIKL